MEETSQPIEPENGLPEFRSFDSVAQDYDESRSLSSDIQERLARRIVEMAGLTGKTTLLDAGVGTGRFALPLAAQGVRVIGLDISRNMMRRLQHKQAQQEMAGAKLSLCLAQADLRRMPIRSQSVQAVLIVHILHLIRDWKTVLREARRVLAPEGVLLLSGERGRRLRTRAYFMEKAHERGLLSEELGGSREEIAAFLTAEGAVLAETEILNWKSRETVSATLEMLRKRTWSSLWAIPDAELAELMTETEDWARREFGSLDTVEEVEAAMQITAVRWPKSAAESV